MLAGIDPDKARGMDRSLMRLALDSAADRASRELAGQPAVRAAVEHTIADSYAAIGEYDLATRHYDDAIAAARSGAVGVDESARIALRRAEIIGNQGRLDEAVAGAGTAFAMVAAEPETSRTRLFIESRLAALECDAGRYEQCRDRYLRILPLQRKTFGDEDVDTLDSIDGLARADSDSARFDQARPLYEALIRSYTAHYGAEHSKTLGAINGLAIVYLEQKQFAEAEKLLASVLPITERVFGPEHPITLNTVNNYGGAIRQQNRNEEARPYYERGVALAYRLYGPDSYRTVIAESNLSLLLRDAGELGDAEKHARIAVEHAAKAFGADNAYRGIMHDSLATILVRERRFADAEKELDTAWNILSNAKDFGPGHPRSQDVVDHCIELYSAWRKPEKEAAWRAKKVAATADTSHS
jgi:non-specific serine/threonine protein kinase/serine/threonine-protein kinase